MFVQARYVYFHFAVTNGTTVHTIQLDDFKKDVSIDEWYKIDDAPYTVHRITIEKDRVDIYLKPLSVSGMH